MDSDTIHMAEIVLEMVRTRLTTYVDPVGKRSASVSCCHSDAIARNIPPKI